MRLQVKLNEKLSRSLSLKLVKNGTFSIQTIATLRSDDNQFSIENVIKLSIKKGQ